MVAQSPEFHNGGKKDTISFDPDLTADGFVHVDGAFLENFVIYGSLL